MTLFLPLAWENILVSIGVWTIKKASREIVIPKLLKLHTEYKAMKRKQTETRMKSKQYTYVAIAKWLAIRMTTGHPHWLHQLNPTVNPFLEFLLHLRKYQEDTSKLLYSIDHKFDIKRVTTSKRDVDKILKWKNKKPNAWFTWENILSTTQFGTLWTARAHGCWRGSLATMLERRWFNGGMFSERPGHNIAWAQVQQAGSAQV